jgi:predicted nucleotidyltransferase
MPEQVNVETIRKKLRQRRETHQKELLKELERITAAAKALGVQKIILFGSAAWGNPGVISDLDLLIIWDTPLDFLSRTTELYNYLQPYVAVDMLVYTPDEVERMVDRPFIRKILNEGRVLYDAKSEN